MDEPPFLAPLSTTIDGLTLRSWQPGDGATLAAVANASYDHLSQWMAWATPDDAPEAAEQRIREFAAKYLTNEDFLLSVWERDTLVGGSGFHPRWGGIETGIAEIGMWVAASHAGRGYGTRILRALVAWGFSDAWPWTRLVWRCDPKNKASARVAEKAGFQHEGTLRGGDGSGTKRDATRIYGLMPEDLTA